MSSALFLSEVKKRIRQLNKIEKSLKPIINDQLEASIECHKKGNKNYYTLYFSDESGSSSSYLSIKDPKTISCYANNKYAKKYLALINKEHTYLGRIEKMLNQENKLLSDYYRMYGLYADSALLTTKVKAQKWAYQNYTQNPYHPEGEILYKTEKGDMVRSRAEVIIADYLFSKDIDYRYESKFLLETCGKSVFPDFTIYDLFHERIVYLEYFGMMSDPDYRVNAFNKINDYAINGITFGNNFIAIFEDYSTSLNIEALKSTINRALGIAGT